MKQNSFSLKNRDTLLAKLSQTKYDLLVIGGGITGAGIALDAAVRGMKVALVEKKDFASGTSSKSTKLIHGGLRYLKQFDFWLVKEVGSERAIVHQLAPHLVVPEKMLLPIIENGTYGTWLTSIGLKVYDILASVEGDDRRLMLDKKEALEKEPLLPKKILKGAGYYAEYRTDDARLTIENIKTAVQKGADCINYTAVTEFLYENGVVSGVRVEDQRSKKAIQIAAKVVVNATGPWVDELRVLNRSKKGKQLHLTKGVHLVVPYEKFPVKQSVYFDVPDGRMMFAIPRGKITYFGTTDTNYQDNKDDVITDAADAIYLISAVNNMFPKIHLDMKDIISTWAGLRPLIHEEGKSASELSRKDEIFVSDSQLISIAGGKLTGYRKMAERVLDKVCEKLKEEEDKNFKKCKTEKTPLAGGVFKNFKEVQKYIKTIAERIAPHGLDEVYAQYLVTTFGRQTEDILKTFESLKPTQKTAEKLMGKAEYVFCAENEMVTNPLDFFIRRTGRLYFDIYSIDTLRDIVFETHQALFGESSEKMVAYKEKLDIEIDKHTQVATIM
ncbi:MAG: glycerol-3-phosphate dehydrogenase/oxidase [Flavobacteriaceae bacterium]|nr:glycerol-3-phosphate dehydrogenase/oxidase [Flavobacteriaceae bacterium]